MRPIKFRGQVISDTQVKTWVHGSLVVDGPEKVAILHGHRQYKGRWEHMAWAVYPKTAGQFTEQFDVEKKEIYDGDILSRDGYPFTDKHGNQNYVGVVGYDVGVPMFHLSRINPSVTDFTQQVPLALAVNRYKNLKKIGNIHDDPELLEEKNENS